MAAKPFGLLYPRVYHMLFYHPDVLSRYDINPETDLNTWEDLIAAGEKVHGKPFVDGGQVRGTRL
jgi:ABC-type glycerol-3-phosphate transport system substrate-binding protein